LTISVTGRIWFTSYNYGGGFGNYVIGRRHQFSIGEKKASDILSLISQYFDNELLIIFATDIGDWEVTITDGDKDRHKFKGSLCGGLAVGDTDLTEFISKHILVDDLFVFSGGFSEGEYEN
jgi:hypothetical protein